MVNVYGKFEGNQDLLFIQGEQEEVVVHVQQQTTELKLPEIVEVDRDIIEETKQIELQEDLNVMQNELDRLNNLDVEEVADDVIEQAMPRQSPIVEQLAMNGSEVARSNLSGMRDLLLNPEYMAIGVQAAF